MAKIVVENATVERVFETRTGSVGVSVTESYTPKDGGDARRTWFTLWFARDPGVQVGQVISASGFVSAKVREYESNGETRHAVDMSVNSARVIDAAPPIAPAPAEDDVWAGGDSSWA